LLSALLKPRSSTGPCALVPAQEKITGDQRDYYERHRERRRERARSCFVRHMRDTPEKKRRAQSKAIPEGASATRWLVSGVYPRRRPWEAFAFGRSDFLEAFAACGLLEAFVAIDLFDLLNVVDVVDALDPFDLFATLDFPDDFSVIDLFAVEDLLGPFDPFDPPASERLSGCGSRA
jgi:hypothetical protein